MISNITTFKLMNMFYTYVNCIIKSSTKTIIKYTWKVLDEVRLCTCKWDLLLYYRVR